MIRQAFRRELCETINKSSFFKDQDFDIRTTDRSNDSSLVVQYRYDPQYSISVTIANKITPSEGDFAISGNATPGDMTRTEVIKMFGRSDFTVYLQAWLRRLKAEIDAVPMSRLVEEQRIEIEQIYARFGTIEDEYFTREEANALRLKLDELEQQMVERIAEAANGSAAADRKITELKSDFEGLKGSVESLRKPGWLKAFATRTSQWVRDPENRALLEDGTKIVKGFLE